MGAVDRYDNTTFNRKQVAVVTAELKALGESRPDFEVDARRELLRLADIADERPHRCLVLVGGLR